MLSDRYYRNVKGKSYILFSPQALINCGAGNCEKAADPLKVLTFLHNYGVPDISCQQYLGTNPQK